MRRTPLRRPCDARGSRGSRGLRRPGGLREESGALSLFVALSAVALLVVIGLVIDGGGRLRALENADAVAQEAARAAGQAIDQQAALKGQGFTVDPAKAEAAGQQYLAASNARGTVVATAQTVTVDVYGDYHTTILALIGLGDLTVHGHGSATLIARND